MKTKQKIMIYIITTLILGSMCFLIIRNAEKDNVEEPKEEEVIKTTPAIIQEIDYEKYIDLRSKAHENETYAILIWDKNSEISQEFLEEVKASFENRKAVVYTLDKNSLSKENYSVIIDDVSVIMNYDNPTIVVPTMIVMTKGEVTYSHSGLMYREELSETLNAKSIE